MKLREEELVLAQEYTQKTPFDGITTEQMKLIMDEGRRLYRWFKAHQPLHITLNLVVLTLLLTADFFVLLFLPSVLLSTDNSNNYSVILLSSVLVGLAHGWLMYSLIVFSIHEGAAHKLIFPPKGPVTKLLNAVANNLCRLSAADPVYYTQHHLSHHAKFGTKEDGEFLNFVRPQRYWITLIPFAMLANFTDFIVHRPLSYSRSRIYSECLTLCYNGLYAYFMIQSFGLIFTGLTLLIIYPHAAFYIDRLRQFSEHNLMPIENRDGARSFGLGFWGLLIGGGPWGQPCHWLHNLMPSIPWYQQIILHFKVIKILTPQQQKQYLLQPLVGYPKLLWHLWKDTTSFERKIAMK